MIVAMQIDYLLCTGKESVTEAGDESHKEQNKGERDRESAHERRAGSFPPLLTCREKVCERARELHPGTKSFFGRNST